MKLWYLPLLGAGILAMRWVMRRPDAQTWLLRGSYLLGGAYTVMTGQWTLLLLAGCYWVVMATLDERDAYLERHQPFEQIDMERLADEHGVSVQQATEIATVVCMIVRNQLWEHFSNSQNEELSVGTMADYIDRMIDGDTPTTPSDPKHRKSRSDENGD
jgi:hypothetical protein